MDKLTVGFIQKVIMELLKLMMKKYLFALKELQKISFLFSFIPQIFIVS